MDSSKAVAIERAREFIDDVLKIYADHGIRSVESEGAYEAAVAKAARAYEQTRGRISPAAQRHPSAEQWARPHQRSHRGIARTRGWVQS